MSTKSIFLSYRRGDSPGYVSRLEDALERAFGEGRVFRDVDDIDAGSRWREVIEHTLSAADVVILVIGPRWEEIWQARNASQTDYLRMELAHARQRGVPVIPVTVGGVRLSPGIDLGDAAWILDNQVYDISDVQGRWDRDVDGLIRLLKRSHGLSPAPSRMAPPPPENRRTRSLVLAAMAVLAVLAVLWFGAAQDSVEVPGGGGSQGPAAVEVPASGGGGNSSGDTRVPDPAAQSVQVGSGGQPSTSTSTPAFTYPVPDIAGLWRGLDGTDYYITQFADGTFAVESPGYADGGGSFIPNMPNKMRISMYGVGDGEFAVSTDGQRAIGWIVAHGQKEYDTLTRIR